MKNQYGDYYLGLDIGTDSLGWAVTDENYTPLKFNRKTMMGIHLFESGKTALERRTFRSARRRKGRKDYRLLLLREIFRKEIEKVDSDFFERLSESIYHREDSKLLKGKHPKKKKYSLFDDDDFNDVDYHNTYKTIYHLRYALIKESGPFDVRLVYLALNHILKHRGHFLFEGDFGSGDILSFEDLFCEMIKSLEFCGISFPEFDESDKLKIEEILKNQSINLREKNSVLVKILKATIPQQKEAIKLLVGSKAKLNALFDREEEFSSEINSLSLKEDLEEKESLLKVELYDFELEAFTAIKSLYDWSILQNILRDSEYLSEAKVAVYEEHKRDLALLRRLVNTYQRKNYKKFFEEDNVEHNYVNYIGRYKGKNNKSVCSQEDFCKFLRKNLSELIEKDDLLYLSESETELLNKINNNTALPKQKSGDNSKIPNQLHKKELDKILENASKYLPFLKEKDSDGYTATEKIKSLMTYRVPYYVGPLNRHSEFSWFERVKGAEEEKIYPWSFDEVVDKKKSAAKFIENLVSSCTYLPAAKVLPKESLLYSKFDILNKLNVLKINGMLLEPEAKKEFFEHFYLSDGRSSKNKVTEREIKQYLISKGDFVKPNEISVSGIDKEIVGQMKAYHDFKRIFDGKLPDDEIVEDIIERITVYGKSKDLLRDSLAESYSFLSDEQIKEITRLNYTGYGRLSKEFLTEIFHIDKETGEALSIIDALESRQDNLQQLLSYAYNFAESIEKFNSEAASDKKGFSYDDIKELYISPAVKRAVWRTVVLVKEIVKITGKAPKKIFVETARDSTGLQRGVRTRSRKEQLEELYKNAKADSLELNETIKDFQKSLKETDNNRLNKRTLFLYYLQMGRCIYTGEPINLSDLYSEKTKRYDIDHIIPRSKVKDDSLDNLVLSKSSFNQDTKKDLYPIPKDAVTQKARDLWQVLKANKMMSQEKYDRLTRSRPLSEDELAGFINRQLVETRQSSKAVIEVFKKIYPDSRVVYSKAGNVAEFRQKFNITKNRIVNDFHHAKDAYLNIVVGNVYDTKFTSNPLNFIKNINKSGNSYSMNKIFDFDVSRGGYTAWEASDGKSISKVKEVLSKNDIRFTRYATTETGEFFDQNPLKKEDKPKEESSLVPIKTKDERFHDTSRYGGYNKPGVAYYFLCEHKQGKKLKRSFNAVTRLNISKVEKPGGLKAYAESILGLKEPRIIIPKIKINSLLSIDGFRGHISGRTGNNFTIKKAVPLIISDDYYNYAKKIENAVGAKEDSDEILKEYYKITSEENLNFYDELSRKLRVTIYRKKLSDQLKTLEEGREIFINLSLREQCSTLNNILILFACRVSMSDLKAIGGKGQVGRLTVSWNIDNADSVELIHQSITGLFEQVIDLKDPKL
ncbi:MAG: type II CRISPR RNA-guided endonuclease Cas9 [Ruminococcaceae bacterium]|nr:type II CRISPR RNA-guided endonuclease Cas9 [Oscillospiraceae bacterium]